MAKEKELMQQIAELKKIVQEQSLITRRTIVKNAQKGDYLELRSKWLRHERKQAHERYMRKTYPAVNNAYKQYKMLMTLTRSHKDK